MKFDFPPFSQAKVLVVGDVMLDRYYFGGTSRISPEAPVPVVNVEQTENRIGGAGNVALNAATLGSAVTLISTIGDDEAGKTLSDKLHSAGIASDFQVSTSAPTITKLRVLSRNQQLLRMDFEKPLVAEDVAQIDEKCRACMDKCGALILSDYAKGVLQAPQKIIDMANQAGIPVLVDPKGNDFERYRQATILTPNMSEFEAVAGQCPTESILAERGQVLMKRLSLKGLLITRGEKGMTLLQPGLPAHHLPARAREVYDVTGAGDTVIAVLAAALASGATLEAGVALANLAAGLVVAKVGTASVSGPELRLALQREQGSERGVVNWEQLLADINDARLRNERIVFTNGCFDILHAGHVGYLEEARRLGDRLVVAVNGDESVSRLKGEGRPINPVERRMAVLSGLESVDWVTVFEGDTPETLLALLRPDVLVKGGDYKKESVVGWQAVEAYGGRVKVLSFLDDCSTSAIVKKVLSGPKIDKN